MRAHDALFYDKEDCGCFITDFVKMDMNYEFCTYDLRYYKVK